MALQDELRATRQGPPDAPRRGARRWDLVAAWAVILGPALGIAVWLGLRQRVGDLEERLVRDANATFSRSFERPVHVDRALPGAFGDAVARHLPSIQAWSDEVKGDEAAREAARAVVDGTAPHGRLPRAYADGLARLAEPLDGLLAGTRAERADLPLAKEGWRPCDGADWSGYETAALLAGLAIRRSLAAGDAAGAAERCLDGLALGRDAAITGGLLGHMTGVAIVKRLWVPCGEAILRLEAPVREAASGRVRTIRDAFPGVAEMLRVEFLGTELMVQRSILSPTARDSLVPRALGRAAEGKEYAGWERLFARDAWRGLRATMDAMLRVAASQEGDGLEEGLRSAAAVTERQINPLAAIAIPAYGRYGRRAEGCVRQLDALVVGAAALGFRERQGRWPRTVAGLAAESGLEPGEVARATGLRLVAAGDGRPLEVRLGLPSGDEAQPTEERVLRITPPRAVASGRRRGGR